jgi:ankyrin repeat protein
MALGTLCKYGHFNSAEALLAESDEIDVNQSVSGSDPPLIVATLYGWIEVVRLLLGCDGIDVNCTDDWGDTAVSVAAQDSNLPILRVLLAVDGIAQNAENEYGDTALMRATAEGRTSVVRVLVTAKGTTDINREDVDGHTLLHNACTFVDRHKAMDIAGVLLMGGSCRFKVNCKGNAPLDMARKNPRLYEDRRASTIGSASATAATAMRCGRLLPPRSSSGSAWPSRRPRLVCFPRRSGSNYALFSAAQTLHFSAATPYIKTPIVFTTYPGRHAESNA